MPLVHHEDAVGVPHGGEPVRNHKAGAPGRQAIERALDAHLGAGVDAAGGLVQNQHGRVGEHHARDGQQLPLALRKAGAVRGNRRGVALFQPADKAVRARVARGPRDLPVGGVRPGVGDIVADGAVEQPGLLRNHAELGAQALAGQGADVVPVDADAAAVHVVEAHQQVDEGGFPRPRSAHDGDAAAGGDVEVEVLDQPAVRRVGEGDVLKLHVPRTAFQPQGARRLRRLGWQVQHFENPLGRGRGGLNLREDVRDVVERLGEHRRVNQERGDAPDRERPPDGADAAEDADGRVGQVVDDARGRVGKGGDELRPHARAVQLCVDFLEFFAGARLVAERRDDLLPADDLLRVAVQAAELRRLLAEQLLRAGRDGARGEVRERRGKHHDQRHGRVQGQHENHRAQNGEHALHEGRQPLQQPVGNGVRIVDEAADRVAALGVVEKADRQGAELAEQRAAQAAHRSVGNAVSQAGQQPQEAVAQKIDRRKQQQNARQRGEVHPAGPGHQIHRAPDDRRPGQRARHVGGCTERGEQQQGAGAPHGPHQPRKGLLRQISLLHVRASFAGSCDRQISR